MKIIAHRGYWRENREKNTQAAFVRALEGGYGIETDFRDLAGELVVSHDPPQPGVMTARAFFDLVSRYPHAGVIAANIKADGLQVLLTEAAAGLPVDRLFVFDMSVPDTLRHFQQSWPVFVRVSEYETPGAALLSRAQGVWFDGFQGEWFNQHTLAGYRSLGLKVCIVSPELHGRLYRPFWAALKDWGLHADAAIHLCTDYPDEAKAFFHD